MKIDEINMILAQQQASQMKNHQMATIQVQNTQPRARRGDSQGLIISEAGTNHQTINGSSPEKPKKI